MRKFWKNLYLVLMLVLFAGLAVRSMGEGGRAGEPEGIIFSDFLSYVKKGYVDSVTIRGDRVEGAFKDPYKEELPVELKEIISRGMGGDGAPGALPGDKRDAALKFNVDIIPYPRLFDLLEEHGVSTDVKLDSPGGFSFMQTIYVLGTVLWLFVLAMMFKSMRSDKFASGKSTARMLVPNSAKVYFKDVLGIDDAKEEVSEIVDFLQDPGRYSRLGAKIPKGVLLVGPPGTGKTLLARAIAGEANVPFFSISGSDFVEMFVGVGASRVRGLFQEAKKHSPCLVFIDEIDAVGRHRGSGYGGGNDEREQTLNQLLVEMDGFESNEGIILIAATNRADVLDEALTRPGRFDRQVYISLPDLKGRVAILKKYIGEVKILADVDVEAVARGTSGFSGAELANLVNEAALVAARKNRKLISGEDFEYARDKILMGTERRSTTMTPEDIRNTAYHEAGHALCSVLLPGVDPIHKATIIPRGAALGMVQQLPERDKVSINITEIRSQIAISMAGRVSEEIFFGPGKVTAGASGDIKQATRLARKSVTEWGLSPKLGAIFYAETATFFQGVEARQNISDETAKLIDAEVFRMVDEGYRLARATITKNKPKMEALAEALMEFETLTGDEVRAIVGGRKLAGRKRAAAGKSPLARSSSVPASAPEPAVVGRKKA